MTVTPLLEINSLEFCHKPRNASKKIETFLQKQGTFDIYVNVKFGNILEKWIFI